MWRFSGRRELALADSMSPGMLSGPLQPAASRVAFASLLGADRSGSPGARRASQRVASSSFRPCTLAPPNAKPIGMPRRWRAIAFPQDYRDRSYFCQSIYFSSAAWSLTRGGSADPSRSDWGHSSVSISRRDTHCRTRPAASTPGCADSLSRRRRLPCRSVAPQLLANFPLNVSAGIVNLPVMRIGLIVDSELTHIASLETDGVVTKISRSNRTANWRR
ncbi:hypothetical protein Pla175_23450 [Pirellulimonas nuda]|uniref:Uncharacterized protein n=1 Tax=Pirellulimonas nuda TaxID=2528009 RepID=A0A518DBW2_9BACT|nr:hypothetical protein Pla175_23450 [Pirellulimonas nuda]